MPRRPHVRSSLQGPSWIRTREPLLWLAGSGREVRTRPSYFFDCRLRKDSPPQVNLQLTLGGAGFHESPQRGRVLVPRGTAWFDAIPGPFSYGYAPEGRAAYEHVFVSMSGDAAFALHAEIHRAFGPVLALGIENPVAPLMLSIARLRTMPDRYRTSALLYQLLMTLWSHLSRSKVETTPRTSAALRLIAEHAPDPSFNVEGLAARLDCSREHLARLFKQSIGVSPSDYLTQHRLRLAARQIRDTHDKLDRIARRSGFSGANYLCRVFRQRVGVTPARFRASPWLSGP